MFLLQRFALVLFVLLFPFSAWTLSPTTELRDPLSLDEEWLNKKILKIELEIQRYIKETGFNGRDHSFKHKFDEVFNLASIPSIKRLGDQHFYILEPESRNEPLVVVRFREYLSKFSLWPEFEIPVLKVGAFGQRLYGTLDYQVYPPLDFIQALLKEDKRLRRTLSLQYLAKSFGINPNWVSPDFRPVVGSGAFPETKHFHLKRNKQDFAYKVSRLWKMRDQQGDLPNFDEGLTREPWPNVLLESQVYAMVFHELFHDVFFTGLLGKEGRKEFEQMLFHSNDREVRNYMNKFKKIGGIRLIPSLNTEGVGRQIGLSEIFARFAAIYYEQEKAAGGILTDRKNETLTSVFHSESDFNRHPLPQKIKDFYDRYTLLLRKRSVRTVTIGILTIRKEIDLSFDSSL